MDRNYNELVDIIKNKYKVDKVYSYSQIKLFNDDPYEYMLKYINKVDPDKETKSPYGLIGGLVHDILEKFHKNEIKRSDCKSIFNDNFTKIMNDEKSGVFSEDPGQNRSISTNLIIDIGDYFSRVDKLSGKILCEEPIYCLLENQNGRHAFLGYIDFLNFNNGKIKIIDYKTSTMYKESDIHKYADQLMIYAEAVKQRYNVDYDSIEIGWNFLKYAKLINKIDLSEEIVERKNLKDYNLNDYLITDCIINIKFNEQTEEDFITRIISNVNNIEHKTKKYLSTGDDSIFSWEVTQKDLFRLNNFCNYTEKLHKPLAEFLNINKNSRTYNIMENRYYG